jgi:hypothetical protein
VCVCVCEREREREECLKIKKNKENFVSIEKSCI